MEVFLDSNIFLRAILRDDKKKAAHCLKLFEKVDRGEVGAATSTLVLNEILWVLEGYKVERKEIAERLDAIARSNLEILGTKDSSIVLESLAYYRDLEVDFIDALNACIARENEIQMIVTYDSHFEKLDFVETAMPESI
ncbi:MAG: PIN domain-containing protein [Candidatus Hydrothermarchaeales archaeon]